jgi:branched-chain amino acid transport system permease protein
MLSYLIFTLTICGIYALLALSLNLIWGGVGLVNLGLAGFFAVGGYASALATGAGAPVVIGWLSALIAGAAVGLIVTFATLRLRDDYLAIVTLGFAEVIRLIALNERWLTNGSDGISGIKAPLKAELGVAGFNLFYLALVSVVVLLVWLLLRRLDASPYGRAMKAIREDQQLAAFAGKDVLRFKWQAFALSAAIAALAGALYGHFQSYISPDHFQPLITIYIFLAVTAGGVGRPTGAVIGAYVVVMFLEGTRFITAVVPGLQPVQLAALHEILVGLALILVLHLRPQGILPERIPKAPGDRVPAKPEVLDVG